MRNQKYALMYKTVHKYFLKFLYQIQCARDVSDSGVTTYQYLYNRAIPWLSS